MLAVLLIMVLPVIVVHLLVIADVAHYIATDTPLVLLLLHTLHVYTSSTYTYYYILLLVDV